MSKYKRFAIIIIVIEILVIMACNLLFMRSDASDTGRPYRVEAARVVRELQALQMQEEEKQLTSEGSFELAENTPATESNEEITKRLDLRKYTTILAVREFVPGESCHNDYLVEQVGQKLYRIEYQTTEQKNPWIIMNAGLGGLLLISLFLLLFVGKKVLKPFHNMTNLSFELAKGNLSTPIKEEKSKFFGRFLWGMDMLRENLESNKEKELALQKEKKTLILSLSHDIKTPLSAIKLYAKALSQNLYDTEEKRREALQGIDKNVKEIEKYVSEIVAASREDFLNLEVQLCEVYLSHVMTTIQTYYEDKLGTLHTKFIVEDMEECLLKADKDRLVEVLQNMLENAIKYGDGKEIRISLREEEDCKLLTVENTGCSLKEEELPNIFDSFYRGSNSRNVKGSGLGLYICRELMRKMDGEIFAELRDGRFLVTAVVQKA